jgi:hypothetical protein
VLHHGAFFESSRRRLAAKGLVLLDFPSTPERLGPAAAALMELVTSAGLVHEGDAELERQLRRVVARPLPKGWSITSGTGETIVAATAAMLAVHSCADGPEGAAQRAAAGDDHVLATIRRLQFRTHQPDPVRQTRRLASARDARTSSPRPMPTEARRCCWVESQRR